MSATGPKQTRSSGHITNDEREEKKKEKKKLVQIHDKQTKDISVLHAI